MLLPVGVLGGVFGGFGGGVKLAGIVKLEGTWKFVGGLNPIGGVKDGGKFKEGGFWLDRLFVFPGICILLSIFLGESYLFISDLMGVKLFGIFDI